MTFRLSAVYDHVCPKCEAPYGESCRRVRKIRRPAIEPVINPHAERYAVQKAWEQPSLFPLDSVRKPAYMGIIERKPLESET